MADGEPSAGTASAVVSNEHHAPVGGPKADVPSGPSLSEQEAARDWQFLMLIISGLVILFTGPFVMNILATALFMILLSPLQVLRYLMTDDTGFPVVSLLLAAAFYGGYSIMPIWLRPPVEKTLLQSGAHMKVGDYCMIDHDGRQLTSSQHHIDIARLKSMGYTPVTILPDFFQADPVIDADGKVYCPVIVAVVKSAPFVDATTTSHGRLADLAPIIQHTRQAGVEQALRAPCNDTKFDTTPGGKSVKEVATPADEETPTGPALGPASVPDESSVVTADMGSNASGEQEQEHTVASETIADSHPKDSLYFPDDNFGSDEPTSSVSAASKGSFGTPSSSGESEVCAEADAVTDPKLPETESGVPEHNDSVVLPFPRLKQITPVELDNLMKVHGDPTFHEGDLWKVFYSKEKFDAEYPGIPSDMRSMIRPLSDDEKDIHYMVEKLRKHVSGATLPSFVEYMYSTDRFRKGSDGLNILITELEQLWAQQKGRFANLEAVIAYEKENTRKRRLPAPPGLLKNIPPGYKEYLSARELVKLNEGTYYYAPNTRDPAESKFMRNLRVRPGMVEMKDTQVDCLGNQILPWLNGVEEEELRDPNAYFPCECGKFALTMHVDYRRKDEAGEYVECLCPSHYQPPQLALLSDEALSQDRERKALEEAHSSAPAGYPRAMMFNQLCDLHAIPTNLPWILMDGVDNLNAVLVGPGDDMPVPGFKKLNKYPDGYRMPQGFKDDIARGFENDTLYRYRLPRCEHGNRHPPFADHCVLCFPGGEHGDCEECSAHPELPEIMEDPFLGELSDEWAVAEDKDRLKHFRAAAYAAAYHEDFYVSWEQKTALISWEENSLLLASEG